MVADPISSSDIEIKDQMRASTRITCVAVQALPRCVDVGISRSLSAVAMARSDVAPAACSSLMIGMRYRQPDRLRRL
jgi:hypothetical protein